MPPTTPSGVLILILAFGVSGTAGAQSAPPVIHRVTLQAETGVLTIAGTGLGGDLLVTLEGQPISVLPGATATQIDALVPPSVLATPGTFRLTVVDLVRQVGDAFVVASQAGRVADGSSNTTGVFNTASGRSALLSNTDGSGNNAFGSAALFSMTTGSDNVAVGNSAGSEATTGSYNIHLGNNVPGTAADTNTMRLGLPYDGASGAGQNRTFLAGVAGTVLTTPAVQVFVDANGQLGTLVPPPFVGSITGGVTPGASERALQDPPATIAELQAALAALRDRVTHLERAAAQPRE